MIKRYPMAYKIVVPEGKPYRASFDTDIRKTIQVERKRLAAEEACKVTKTPTLVVDTVASAPMPIYRFPRKLK